MPIHPKSKIVFIHIPKSGGSSFEKCVLDSTGEPWQFWGKIKSESYSTLYPGRSMVERINPDRERFDPKYREGVYHHLTLNDLNIALGNANLSQEGYRFVSIYRNPFDRLVSMYEYGIQTGGRMLTKGKSFAQWFYDRPVSPQSWKFLADKDRNISPLVKILDFSSFGDEVQSFLADCGIEVPRLPWEKKSARSDWRTYYDETMLDLLSKECSDDLALASLLNFAINS